MNKIIIHICGASGSGKTHLGNKLYSKLKSQIILKDLDDLRDEFIKSFYGDKSWKYIDEIKYQEHIDKFISKQTKPIIFVGLNDNTVYGKNKKLYYNLHSKYNYYIDLDDMDIVKQKCLRLLNSIQEDDEAMGDLVNDNKQFIKQFVQAIKNECGTSQTIKMNKRWKRDYIAQGYILASRESIYKSVMKIL